MSVALLLLNQFAGCSKESGEETIGKDGAITNEEFEKLKKDNPDYFKNMENKKN